VKRSRCHNPSFDPFRSCYPDNSSSYLSYRPAPFPSFVDLNFERRTLLTRIVSEEIEEREKGESRRGVKEEAPKEAIVLSSHA